MKNVTITLDETTAAWTRVHAAKHNTSVSRLVGEMLQQRMSELQQYDRAMRSFLSKAPSALRQVEPGEATRDDLHERAGLR